MRRGLGLCLVLGLLGVTSGCGDDPIESYCAEVEVQQKPITEAVAAGATGLLLALPSFEALRDKAPDDIADKWAVVVQRISVLEEALDDAGVDPASYDPEQPPADLSKDELAAITAAASGLVTEATTEALDSVQQHARDVCKTPLSL
ncbi:hypothetical protein BH09ACT12_BH09ACT12_37470 [soil metagenome]